MQKFSLNFCCCFSLLPFLFIQIFFSFFATYFVAIMLLLLLLLMISVHPSNSKKKKKKKKYNNNEKDKKKMETSYLSTIWYGLSTLIKLTAIVGLWSVFLLIHAKITRSFCDLKNLFKFQFLSVTVPFLLNSKVFFVWLLSTMAFFFLIYN